MLRLAAALWYRYDTQTLSGIVFVFHLLTTTHTFVTLNTILHQNGIRQVHKNLHFACESLLTHCCQPTQLTLSLFIPARVICWQSYSSIRSRLWQLFRCSSEASVIRGQLSSSITSRRSWAQGPLPRCLMPSSVISSQCDRLYRNTVVPTQELYYSTVWESKLWFGACKCYRSKICSSRGYTLTRTCKRGQWIESWMSVPSVIWWKPTHVMTADNCTHSGNVKYVSSRWFIYLHTFF